jgi:hypothetical protein
MARLRQRERAFEHDSRGIRTTQTEDTKEIVQSLARPSVVRGLEKAVCRSYQIVAADKDRKSMLPSFGECPPTHSAFMSWHLQWTPPRWLQSSMKASDGGKREPPGQNSMAILPCSKYFWTRLSDAARVSVDLSLVAAHTSHLEARLNYNFETGGLATFPL